MFCANLFCFVFFLGFVTLEADYILLQKSSLSPWFNVLVVGILFKISIILLLLNLRVSVLSWWCLDKKYFYQNKQCTACVKTILMIK